LAQSVSSVGQPSMMSGLMSKTADRIPLSVKSGRAADITAKTGYDPLPTSATHSGCAAASRRRSGKRLAKLYAASVENGGKTRLAEGRGAGAEFLST